MQCISFIHFFAFLPFFLHTLFPIAVFAESITSDDPGSESGTGLFITNEQDSGESDEAGDEEENQESGERGEEGGEESNEKDDSAEDEPSEEPGFDHIILNEINLEAEFIEIWNAGTELSDLQNFEFSELSAGNEKRHAFADFADTLTVEPDSFLVLEMSRLLNNTGETIRLYVDSESLTPIEEIQILNPETGKSYARQDDAFIWADPTPDAVNFADQPNEEGDKEDDSENGEDESDDTEEDDHAEDGTGEEQNFESIILSEVDLETEFIEIWNSGLEEADLSNFEFSEISGENEKRHPFSDFTEALLLQGGGFLILEMTSKLNNTGETIKIYSDSSEETPLQSLEIPKSESGQSYARTDEDTFSWTTPTPGLANIFPDTEDEGNGEENNEDEGNEEENIPPLTNLDFQNLLISEVSLHDEFIEFWNTGNDALDLSAFEFSELSGENEVRRKIVDFLEDPVIGPGAFLVLSLSNKLNNSGEIVRLFIHPDTGDALREIVIPKLSTGQSYARDENGLFHITLEPTPGAENIILAPPTSGGSGGGGSNASKNSAFFQEKAKNKSLEESGLIVQISEVSFSDSQHDRIELFCAKCGDSSNPIDLKGFRVFDDRVFFEFPPETFVYTGDYIVLEMKSESEKKEKTEYGWKFFISHKGLTSTDETLMLLDSNNALEDTLCWTNHNGNFSPGEKEDIYYMTARNEWGERASFHESTCFPSHNIKNGGSVSRKGTLDTDTAEDFFPSSPMTFGFQNSSVLQSAEEGVLQIESLLFLPEEKVLVQIKNKGEKAIKTNGFSLAQNGSKKEELSLQILSPGSSTSVLLDIGIENILLELKDAWGETEDFLCLNIREYQLSSQDTSLFRTMFRKRLWHSREISSCPDFDLKNGGMIQIKNSENGIPEFFDQQLSYKSISESPSLFIARIMPNPQGIDDGNEWLELSTHAEILNLSDWMIMVGKTLFTLPEQKLARGETLKLSSQNAPIASIRNTDGEILLFSPDGEIYSVLWETARDGDILELRNGMLFWESEKAELYKSRIDFDSDLIPDGIEIMLDGDPTEFDGISSRMRKRYARWLKNRLQVAIKKEAEKVILHGLTEPNTKITLFLHSEASRIDVMSDAKGAFFAEVTHPLSAGDHALDVLIITPEGMRAFKKNAYSFTLEKGIRDDEIFEVAIVSVVPNPKGKDTGNEQITLKNISGKDGFIRNWKFSNGKKEINIPDIFFEKNEVKVFAEKAVVPTLTNAKGQLALIDYNGVVLDFLEWEKARDDERIGRGIARMQVGRKTSSKKSQKKKKQKEERIFVLEPASIFGILQNFSEQFLTIISDNSETRRYAFHEKNPQHILLLSKVLQEGMPITLNLSPERKILSFQAQEMLPKQQLGSVQQIATGNQYFRIYISLLVASLLGISFFFYLKKFRSRDS